MPKSSVRSGDRLHSYALGAAIVVVAVLILFVLRPTTDARTGGAPGASEDPADVDAGSVAPVEVQASGPPKEATDEEFCAEFVRLAEGQAQFVGEGETNPDQLERAADALLAAGVPANMSLSARNGYFTLLAGVYETLGMGLAPEAVGAVPAPIDGSDAAFATYLGAYCPA